MKLPQPFTKDKTVINVVIETPRNSRSKYTYDEKGDFFKLSKILPEGLVFPLHFGCIPFTKGEDGDPLDVLVLMDEPSFTGCIAECRLVGTLVADQTEKNKTIRNDRIIAVAVESPRYKKVNSIQDLDKTVVREIINFMKYYNKMAGKEFRVLRYLDGSKTLEMIQRKIEKKKKAGT
jgi:inorganic pyrophosphatase